LDAPAGAVIGVPGKTERCGSNSTCVLLDSAVFVKIVVHFFKPLAARIRCSVAAAGLG
jgi:hypothetical protein